MTGIALDPMQRKMARSALFGSYVGERQRTFRNFYQPPKGANPATEAWLALAAQGGAIGWSDLDDRATRFCLTHPGALAALEPGESLDPEDFPEALQQQGREDHG